MAFFKFRSRGPQANEGRNTSAAAAPAESVESMRRRARHRLLGAAILLLVGVIGFPLLFDTQPRPIAVDIPIEIPDRNKVAPLPQPPSTAKAQAPAANGEGRVAQAPSSSAMITESADGTELPADRPVTRAPAATSVPVPPPAPAARPDTTHKAEAKPEVKPESKPKPKTETRPETVAKPAPAPKPATPDDGARARALLDGQGAAAARQAAAPAPAPAPAPAAASEANGRFVIQVGAFADAAKAREVRQKLERAGLKTYTNVAKTADGERTRVRVGPFASRTEADQAAGKVKGLALPAAVLGL
ncbi:MAG: SPOR domain-containing protein [Variovorax sp.]|nr:MAG: SPOR domain-containing protein [Variovorax sp.]